MKGKTLQLIIIFGILNIAFLSLYVFAYFYIQGKMIAVAEIKQEVNTIREENEQLANLTSVIRQIESDQAQLRSYFVEQNDIIIFLEELESLGDVTGAVVEVKTIEEIEGDGTYGNQLDLNVTAQGSWEEVYHFLTLLENFPIKLVIDQSEMRTIEAVSTEENPEEIWLSVLNFRVLLSK